MKIALQILSAGQLRGQAAEDHAGAPLRQQSLELFEHVGRGEIHALHPSHVEDDGAAAFEIRLQLGEQPIGGAEKQVALQLADRGLPPNLQQGLFLHGQALLLRRDLVATQLAADH